MRAIFFLHSISIFSVSRTFFSLLYRFHKLHVVYLFFFFMCVIYSSGLNSFPFRLVWLSIDSFCSFIVCFDVDLACSTFCFFFLLNPFNAPLCRASKSILIRFWNWFRFSFGKLSIGNRVWSYLFVMCNVKIYLIMQPLVIFHLVKFLWIVFFYVRNFIEKKRVFYL